MLIYLSKSYDRNSSQKICMKYMQKYHKMYFVHCTNIYFPQVREKEML